MTQDIFYMIIFIIIISSAAIAIGVWYFIQVIKYVKNEQKEASEKAKGGIDPNAFEGDFVEAARRQMNF